ncbi:MAG: lamin tail domain-containing protein, partial [Kiritimatiellae bacterium]|nr:lamin tail domain-containing protein [Kiritimatiellia bacterium]
MCGVGVRQLILLTACGAFLACAGSGFGASNYLQNAGFEEAGSSSLTAAHWEWGVPDEYGDMWGTASRRSWRARSGSYEGAICGTWADPDTDHGIVQQQFRIEGGRSYTFSGWFWSDNAPDNTFTAGTMGIWISYYTNSPDWDNLVESDVLRFEEPGSIWTYHELSVEAPVEAEWAEVYIYAYSLGYHGALQFDDLYFGEEDEEEGGRPAPGPMNRRTPLIFSEIMYHPSDAELEFIELFNSEPFTQDLGGYSLKGDMAYDFPEGTQIGPTGYLVVAASPSALAAAYGLSVVLGPYEGSLPNGGGTVRLLNESGAVLLETEYDDHAPWPAAADGAGFALVPAEESFGPSDVRSWRSGTYAGGSPGRVDPVCEEPFMQVVINEVLTHTDPPLGDYVELYNCSPVAADLAGCVLTDSKTSDVFVLPSGTVIPGYGFLSFDTNALGFNLSSYGETVYLKGPGGTGLVDAVEFGGLPNGMSYGRYPDGGAHWGMQQPTEAAANYPFELGDVVINEIMFHPISGEDRDEYIELYNQGEAVVDVSGWRLSGGVELVFPSGCVIPADGYLVAAKDPEHVSAVYEALSQANTVGPYEGKLSDRSERIVLEALDDPMDPEQAWVVMDEVTYYDGGRWGEWSDGGGSSLELKNPDADNRMASNWADSAETGKSVWVTNSLTRVAANGMLVSGESISRVELFMLRKGECLVDEVEMISTGGGNRVVNAGFESGSSNWDKRGTHRRSASTDRDASEGERSEWICASGGGDTRGNGLSGELSEAVNYGDTVTLSVCARWLRGSPFLYMRLLGGYLNEVIELPVPAALGTPGERNSVWEEAGCGPAISGVLHEPPLPREYEQVQVCAQVSDPDGLASVMLRYRYDSTNDFSTSEMYLQSNGVYSGAVWGGAVGTVVEFYLNAQDGSGMTTTFPADAPARTCLVRFGESDAGGDLGAYHIITTEETMNTWSNRSPLNNELLDCTFIAGNRVIYNAGIRYRGSPFLRKMEDWINDPQNASAAYRVEFPKDDRYLDAVEMNLDWQELDRDRTYQRERTAFWMAREIGLPAINQRYVVVYLNGKKRSVLYTDSQHIEEDYIESWYPDRAEGDLHKINDWVEYAANPDVRNFVSRDASLTDYRVDGVRDVERYRWCWERNNCGGYDQDYGALMMLVDAANLETNRTQALEAVMDVRQWMKTIALRHVVDDWDSFGFERGKNMFAYRPDEGKWDLLNWDIDFGFGAGGDRGVETDPFSVDQKVMPIMYDLLHHDYAFRRLYWQALEQLVNGPMADSALAERLDEVQAALTRCGLTDVYGVDDLLDWIAGRRAFLLEQLDAVTGIPFECLGTEQGAAANSARITGRAPILVYHITVDGVRCSPVWISDTIWQIDWPLSQTSQTVTVQGLNGAGLPLVDMIFTQECLVGQSAASPEESLVINEIMVHPSSGGVAFIELFNRSSNTAFNLYRYRLQGVDLTFEEETVIQPLAYLTVASDRQRYVHLYGVTNIPVASWSGTLANSGERLALVRLNSTGGVALVVDEVVYEDVPPWPAEADGGGASLQLIDASQDNSRVGNWGADSKVGATPNA